MIKVKIIIFILFLSSAFVLRCAEIKVERYAQNNIFYSSVKPKIKIEINPDYKYIDNIEGTYYLKYTLETGDRYGTDVDKAIYLFGIIGNNKILERGIAIRIYTMRFGYWVDDLYANTKYKIDSGFVNISKKRYQYAVFSSTARYSEVEENLFDKGVKVPNCCIVKSIARIAGVDKRTFLKIDYMEDISFNKDRPYSCKEWRDINQLSEYQKLYLKQLFERSEKVFKILN